MEKTAVLQQLGVRSEKIRENQLCSAPGECSRRAGGAPGTQQQFPCGLCRERPLVEQAVPLQPMGPTWSRSPRCSPWVEEPPVEQVDVAWRRLQPMESPRRSRGSGGSCCPWGPVLEQFAPGGWTPWYGAVWERFLKPLQSQFGKDGIPWEGPHVEQRQRGTVKERWIKCRC